MKFIRKLMRTSFIVLTCLFSSIFLFSCSFLIESNVSKDKRFENIAGKIFQLQQDVFIYQWIDTGKVCIGPPQVKCCSYFPSSINEYLEDPENWYYKKNLISKENYKNKGVRLHTSQFDKK